MKEPEAAHERAEVSLRCFTPASGTPREGMWGGTLPQEGTGNRAQRTRRVNFSPSPGRGIFPRPRRG